MIPMELLTAGGGALVGGALKLWARKMEADQQKFELMAGRERIHQSGIEAARKWVPKGGEATRRLIVMAVMFAVFVAPTALAWLHPQTPVFYGYSESTRGFLFFWESIDKMKFYEMRGLVILPIHTHMAAAIAGFYFGAGVAKAR